METNEEIAIKLAKAKTALALSHPFFASRTLLCKFNEDTTNKYPFWTDGEFIGYNPELLKDKPLDFFIFGLAHEAGHIYGLDHIRKQNRDHELFNIAADFKVNQILKDSGFTIPEECLYNPFYKGKSLEEIYSILSKQKEQEDENEKDSKSNKPGNGKTEDTKSGEGEKESIKDMLKKVIGEVRENTRVDKKEEEAKIEVQITQAARSATKRGKMTAELDRFVESIVEEKIPPMEVLNRFLVEKAKEQLNWNKPDKRFVKTGLYLPVRESSTLGEILFFVDTSGSLNTEVLNKDIKSELQAVVTEFKMRTTIAYVDTDIKGIDQFEPDEDIVFKPKGGGGTDYRKAFEWFEKEDGDFINPVAIIYYTDGFCRSFPKDCSKEVLWILPSTNRNENFLPTFGEVIKL